MANRPAALAVLVALLAWSPARAADPVVERAIQALDRDPSMKVRTQAALVLAQRNARTAIPALVHALSADESAAVRIAAASALARLSDLAAKEPLEAAGRADPDPGVRSAASRALGELLASSSRALALDEPQGELAGPAARAALHEALSRHLRRQGFAVVAGHEPAGYRLKPSVLELDVAQAGGKLTISVKVSVVAVDSQGRMAAMVEGGARLRARGGQAGGGPDQLAARALDAAAVSLSEDLAARLR